MSTETEAPRSQAEIDAERMALGDDPTGASLNTTEVIQADYFGFNEVHRVLLPDGISYVDHKSLNEGARRQYMNRTNREVRVQKTTGDAIMPMATGDERRILMEQAIIGWNIISNKQPVPFNRERLTDFLTLGNPVVIDLIDKDVRKHNPWLRSEMSVEDIDAQIVDLQRQRADKFAEEEGKAS